MWGNKKTETQEQTKTETQGQKASAAPSRNDSATPIQRATVSQSVPEASSSKQPVVNPVTNFEGRTSMNVEATRGNVTPVGSGARLGASIRVKGEISGSEDLHIDGTVEGLVQLDGRKLTVGMAAKVTADVMAREIVVYGSVKGNLRATDKIEIKKDGSVVGDLTTARIMIEDGAYFKGAIEIDRQSAASESHSESTKPAYSRVPATVSAD
jgi:cytoskeletal protein CcmA (bactofilin family)